MPLSTSSVAPTWGKSAFPLAENNPESGRFESLRRLIIADSHVGTIEGDTERMEALLRRAADEGVDEIIYLGDAFLYLIGMKKFWTLSLRRILRIWDELRAEGMKIILIEGNRDFFLDEPSLKGHCDRASLSVEFSAGKSRFFLVHGDKVNSRDFQYLFWSRISKCRLARFFAGLLPGRLANAIVTSMEARLARTNRKFRYERPEDELKAEAERLFDRGFDRILFGHFHSAWRYETRRGCACIVPAWLESGLSLLVEGDGSWELVDEELQSCPWPGDEV